MEIKHIKKVEVIEACYITKTNLIGNRYVVVEHDSDFTQLDTKGLSQLDISDKIENKVRIYTLKLVAQTLERFIVGNKKFVFKVTAVSGECYLIGTEERPYPVINNSESYPNEPAGKAGNTLTVTYSQLFIAQIP
jgi:hypothetical protein